tara:strand:+ start:3086 stop:4114 length:1029 start_codon:yes stop_codon:yes gene_type:complete
MLNGIWFEMTITRIISVSTKEDLSKLFELGFNWSDTKCINFIYVPDSELAASVFTLGLLCRDLCDESKNDRNLHFNKLLDNAHDYLVKCASCKYICQPEITKCGRFEQAKSQYKKIGETHNYTVEAFDFKKRTITVSFTKKATKRTPFNNKTERVILEGYSEEWHIHGTPSLIQHAGKPSLGDIYTEMTKGKAIQNNLSQSYSKINFVISNLHALNKLNELEIEVNGKLGLIGQLLTLSNDRISRINPILAINLNGIESGFEPKSIIFSNLYSFFKVIDVGRIRNLEKIIFFSPEESDQKLNSLYEYISLNRDWISHNEKKSDEVVFYSGLQDTDVIVFNES